MDTPEPRRPLIGRLRRALLGTRAGTIGSAARNVDSLVTSGHQHLDSDSDSESGSVVDADADADADAGARQDGAGTTTRPARYPSFMLPAATPRLRFREMGEADLDDMALLLGDRAVMEFYPRPKTRDEAAAWIAWNQRNYAEHGYGLWIVETHSGEFVGDCGLTWQEVNGVAKLEVGYHVRAALHGRGLATEAAAACRDFARDHTDASELVAIIHPDNRASERVAEKIGMVRVDDDRGGIQVRTVLRMSL